MRCALILTILAALHVAVPARADSLSDGVKAIPGTVEDLRVAGNWEADGKTGAYRIVVARTGGEAMTARLFIQWVVYGNDGGATVDHSVEIAEIAALKVDIANYNAEADPDGLSVYVDTVDASGAGQSYELFVLSRTEYRFGPASN